MPLALMGSIWWRWRGCLVETEYTKGFKAGLAWEREYVRAIVTGLFENTPDHCEWGPHIFLNQFLDAIEETNGPE